MNEAKEKKNTLSVLKFQVNDPPIFFKKLNKEWIYQGLDNLYPEYLIDLYNRSSTHNAIINGLVDFTMGKGLTGPEDFLKKANAEETWNEVLRKVTFDYCLYNSGSLEVKRNRLGEVSGYFHLEVGNVRVNINETKYFFSEDWGKKNQFIHHDFDDRDHHNGHHHAHSVRHIRTNFNVKPIDFKLFDPENKIDQSGERELIFFKGYQPMSRWYTKPKYVGSLAAIESEAEMDNYDLNALKNGFLGGTLINMGQGEPADKGKIEREVQQTIGGSNGVQIMLNFNDGDDDRATVEELPSGADFEQIRETALRARDKIFTGHGVTSKMLFGVSQPGQLSGRTELIESWELMMTAVIKPKQEVVLNIINMIAGLEGISEEIEIEQMPPIGAGNPVDAKTFVENLTPEEIREIGAEQFGIELSEQVEVEQQMSKLTKQEQIILNACRKYGKNSTQCKVSRRRAAKFEAGKLVHFQDEDDDMEVLNIIQQNPEVSMTDIAKAENRFSLRNLIRIIAGLISIGLIERDETRLTTTSQGEEVAADIEDPVKLEIRYQYVERPNALPLVEAGTERQDGSIRTQDGETREFCQELLAMDKLFSREEIENINNDLGTDVWMTRGGWYTVPDKDVALPFCRHIWDQVLVEV